MVFSLIAVYIMAFVGIRTLFKMREMPHTLYSRNLIGERYTSFTWVRLYTGGGVPTFIGICAVIEVIICGLFSLFLEESFWDLVVPIGLATLLYFVAAAPLLVFWVKGSRGVDGYGPKPYEGWRWALVKPRLVGESVFVSLFIFLASLALVIAGQGKTQEPAVIFEVNQVVSVVSGIIFAVSIFAVAASAFRYHSIKYGRWGDQRQARDRFISDMKSKVGGVPQTAVIRMRTRGWLTDGSLRGVNLERASLGGANLEGATLEEVNLEWAYLNQANLSGADLSRANLRNSSMAFADLQGAKLCGANLEGANLFEANLQGADLAGAVFNYDTALPDIKKWTPKTDMARFTDSRHPEFWRSDKSTSPAYRKDQNAAR